METCGATLAGNGVRKNFPKNMTQLPGSYHCENDILVYVFLFTQRLY